MAGQKTMFSFRNKRRLVKKSENLNKYGPFFIIFPLPVMLKFTVHLTAVHLFTCVVKAVTSRRSREYKSYARAQSGNPDQSYTFSSMFLRTFQESPLNSNTFQACANHRNFKLIWVGHDSLLFEVCIDPNSEFLRRAQNTLQWNFRLCVH